MTDAISLCQSSLKGQPAAADRNERKENGENRGREIERGIMRERKRRRDREIKIHREKGIYKFVEGDRKAMTYIYVDRELMRQTWIEIQGGEEKENYKETEEHSKKNIS